MALARTGGGWCGSLLVTGLFHSLVSFVFSKSALGAVFFEDMSGTETVSGKLLKILHHKICSLRFKRLWCFRVKTWRLEEESMIGRHQD